MAWQHSLLGGRTRASTQPGSSRAHRTSQGNPQPSSANNTSMNSTRLHQARYIQLQSKPPAQGPSSTTALLQSTHTGSQLNHMVSTQQQPHPPHLAQHNRVHTTSGKREKETKTYQAKLKMLISTYVIKTLKNLRNSKYT